MDINAENNDTSALNITIKLSKLEENVFYVGFCKKKVKKVGFLKKNEFLRGFFAMFMRKSRKLRIIFKTVEMKRIKNEMLIYTIIKFKFFISSFQFIKNLHIQLMN